MAASPQVAASLGGVAHPKARSTALGSWMSSSDAAPSSNKRPIEAEGAEEQDKRPKAAEGSQTGAKPEWKIGGDGGSGKSVRGVPMRPGIF